MPAPLSRRVMLLSGACAALGGCAAPAVNVAAPSLLGAPAAHLPGSHTLDLRDPASGRTWRIWLQRPEGPAPAPGYPVFYTLDGNAAFALAAQLARNRASRPPVLRPDGVLVVGIGHPVAHVIDQPSRARDYTPPTPGQPPSATHGGADLLLDFIEHTLQPQLAQALPLDPQRQTLFGHSFGGLMVLHTLFTRPAMFTRYAAASPSIWWNQAQILDSCTRFEAAHATAPGPCARSCSCAQGAWKTPPTPPPPSAPPSSARAAPWRAPSSWRSGCKPCNGPNWLWNSPCCPAWTTAR